MAGSGGSSAPLTPWFPCVPTCGNPGRAGNPDRTVPVQSQATGESPRCGVGPRHWLRSLTTLSAVPRPAAPAAIGASPSNRAGGGPSAVTVHSLDWQKLPGYW
ncbi:hypothetical protein GCM10010309_25450 [Streptomyces violaceochromogenes]|nr:hypothetical protein GCM10010309_25450 [Streptomyces violaceochromogenes]